MSAELLSSKLVVQEEPPTLRTIDGVATGVFAFPGISAKGPVGVSTLILSFDQYVKVFGGDIPNGYSSHVARGFFSGGGRRLYFTRVVHYTDITNAASKTSAKGTFNLLSEANEPYAAQVTGGAVGPFALTTGDTLVISRDSAGQATATFTGTRASITAENSGPFALEANQTFQLRIDGGSLQTITFTEDQFVDIEAASSAEVIAVLNDRIVGGGASVGGSDELIIFSDSRGTGSGVEIVGGSARATLGFNIGTTTGTGNVADLSAVTVAEIKTVVELAVSGVTVTNVGGAVRISGSEIGVSAAIQVMSASTADDELALDNTAHYGGNGEAVPTLQVDAKYDGTYSAGVTVMILPATSGRAVEFNLNVLAAGVVVERFPNLSMLDSSTRYVETVINATEGGSNYIEVTDLDVSPGPSGVAAERPANSPGSPPVAFGPLVGGNDGLTSLDEVDFVGDEASQTGFHSFDLNSDIDVLACPEVATPATANAGLSYCSVTRGGEVFFIVDPPAGLSPAAINTYVVETAGIKNSTEFGAIYWPRVKVLNPNAALYGTAKTIVVPPSGHIAGMYARVDGSRVGGVYQPPGGVERGTLPGVLGFENDAVLDERVRDLISPNLINPISRVRGWPIAVDDVMTLQAGGNFPTVSERRGVMFIERSVKDGMQFCRLRNNDASLRRTANITIEAFLLAQMKAGAFRSTNPSEAFYIDTSEALNPASEQFAGRLNIRIGLATNKPARWVILTFTQDTRALDEQLAAAS